MAMLEIQNIHKSFRTMEPLKVKPGIFWKPRQTASTLDVLKGVNLTVNKGDVVSILGPSVVPLRGGMAGTYLATTGEAGHAVLHCKMEGALDTEATLTIRKRD